MKDLVQEVAQALSVPGLARHLIVARRPTACGPQCGACRRTAARPPYARVASRGGRPGWWAAGRRKLETGISNYSLFLP